MKPGDVVINIPAPKPNGLKVIYRGVAPRTDKLAFKIEDNSQGWSIFYGTTEELFTHITKIIKAHNKQVLVYGKGVPY